MLKKEKRLIKQGLPPPDECYGINNIINQEDEAIHTQTLARSVNLVMV